MAYFLQYTDYKNHNSRAKGHPETMQLIRGKEREADQALTTEAHLLLWRYLRLLELRGVTFIRHASIGGHYVDFLNREKGVVMEVDAGQSRKTDKLEQERKDRWLAKQGFKVLRFTEEEIITDMNIVLDMMWESFIDEPYMPYPNELAADEPASNKELTADNGEANADAKKMLDEPTGEFTGEVVLIREDVAAAISGRDKPR